MEVPETTKEEIKNTIQEEVEEKKTSETQEVNKE
jgi:hypothetical protein